VVANLAEQAATVVARQDYDVVIATGGETMAAILDRLGVSRFILTRELEPGFPVGRAERADGSALTIAMKAGGFGSPSTLLDAARDLLAQPLPTRLPSMTPHDAPLAVTMGDPSGIGPEIIAKMYLRRPDKRHWIVVGDPLVMTHALGALDADVRVRPIAAVNEAVLEDGILNVLCSSQLSVLPPVSQVSAVSGRAAYDAIVMAIGLARDGHIGGIVTAPINKEALAAAGLHYPGHTEILADYGGAAKVAMMLANEDIRTVLVTIHCSLSEAIAKGDFAAQMDAIRLAHAGAQALGISNPRVAVAGLNPHAGEGGLFGDEEIHIIAPAIKAARAEGIDASGPWPGDTVFMQARNGRFDIVVAQYHDQGLIPVKYMGLDQGVNVTLGLPFVRTSPDHGTAFDIAGTGIADPSSFETAFDYALRLKASRPNQKAVTP
jgi:4-hydroxythreonine-4-phosphate dehydrogenase